MTEEEMVVPESVIKEVYDEFCEEEEKRIKEENRINQRILKAIKTVKGQDFFDDLIMVIDDTSPHGEFMIVNKPWGERQSESYGSIKEMWVTQSSSGDSGDSFYGTVGIKIKEKKWLCMHFST